MLELLQSLLLVCALSLDAFVASIAYGINKIAIPLISVIIINIVCSTFLALSIFFGAIVKRFVPGGIAVTISFLILMLLGIYYLFEGLVKAYLEEAPNANKKVKFKLFDLRFVLDIYVDETKADMDDSHHISSKEALYLAVALSLDSIAAGFGCSLGNINYMQVTSLSLIFGMATVWGGLFIGKKLVAKSRVNLSWLSGVILIILALLKLV